MGKKIYLGFLVSLLIHITLLLWGFFSLPTKDKTRPSTEFQLLLSSQKPAALSSTKKKSSKNQSTKTKNNKAISLNDFKPTPYFTGQGPGDTGHSEQGTSYGALEGDVNATMNQMSLSEYSGNRLFFEMLRTRFDQSIQYPQELVEHNIQGKNWVKILINHKGQLIKILDASAQQPALKAFTIIGIYQALKTGLPKKYWYNKKRNLTLQLNFDFQIFTFGNQQSRSESRYHKNRFDFLRVQNGPDFIREFVAVNARYIPPIIPLPGGFFFSFTQVYNLVKAWSEMDPRMRKVQRKEMTLKKLDLMMEKAQDNF